jgi:hypothetical protein
MVLQSHVCMRLLVLAFIVRCVCVCVCACVCSCSCACVWCVGEGVFACLRACVHDVNTLAL